MNNRKGMNRFLLTSVSAIAVGFASAALAAGGGAVYLSQDGHDQTATIHQDGGTGNKVGSSAAHPFSQDDGTGTGSNVLVINQNFGADSELSNIGAFVHTGSDNTVTGFQSGTTNSAEIDQEGNSSSVKLQQTGANNGRASGSGSSGVDPWFNGSYGDVILQDQTADGSKIVLTQTTNIHAPNGNVFSIGQGGSNNKITATQTGYNKLWIRQGTTGPDLWSWNPINNPFDPANTLHSLSTLHDSTITVNQTVGGIDASLHNYVALGQGNGGGDKITVTQTGASNSVDVNQIGSGNIFTSTQTSSNSNAYATENFVGGEAGYPDNNADPLVGTIADNLPITQIGSGNEYYSLQSGTSEWAFGSQIGNNNFLSNNQSGDGNKLYSAQNGDDNQIFATQDGSANTAWVSQNHSASLASFTQTGAGNNATITQ